MCPQALLRCHLDRVQCSLILVRYRSIAIDRPERCEFHHACRMPSSRRARAPPLRLPDNRSTLGRRYAAVRPAAVRAIRLDTFRRRGPGTGAVPRRETDAMCDLPQARWQRGRRGAGSVGDRRQVRPSPPDRVVAGTLAPDRRRLSEHRDRAHFRPGAERDRQGADGTEYHARGPGRKAARHPCRRERRTAGKRRLVDAHRPGEEHSPPSSSPT